MRRRWMAIGVSVAVLLGVMSATPAAAQEFSLQVGPPIAAIPQPGTGPAKTSKAVLLVVRPVGCADPAAARMTGTAEGMVDGVRRRVALTLEPLASPGVHAISRGWADGGTWIVTLAGTCGGQTAGALVSLGPQDLYRREAVQPVAGSPTPAQVDAALRAAAQR
jgi:hypothetical protein